MRGKRVFFSPGLPGMDILRGIWVFFSAREGKMWPPAREKGAFSAWIAGDGHSARELGMFFCAGNRAVVCSRMVE